MHLRSKHGHAFFGHAATIRESADVLFGRSKANAIYSPGRGIIDEREGRASYIHTK